MWHKEVRLEIQRETSHRNALRLNAVWIVLTLPFLLLPYLRPSEKLPDMCVFHRLTSIPCMFCGFTRAFEHMAGGIFHAALFDCPAAVALYLGMWTALISATALTLNRRSMAFTLSVREKQVALSGAGLILLANWIWRLF